MVWDKGYKETEQKAYYVLSIVGSFHCVFGREGKEFTMETEMLHPNQKPAPEANPARLGKLLGGRSGHILIADPQEAGTEDPTA